MIAFPTVFVIGAGGSVPYGFESGPGMLRTARGREPDELLADTHNYFPTAVRSFRDALIESESDSIDSLLEHRSDLDHIGRAYMAASILRAENGNRDSHPKEGDWLSYLFKEMDSGGSIEAFARNDVTFITYNYDRRIEYRISRGLYARYRATSVQLEALLTARPVIHLHGAVGTFLPGPRHVPYGARNRDDSIGIETAILNNLRPASEGIKIVHQADGNADEFVRARSALQRARRIIFLGFSFGTANVDRLGLECISPEALVICGRYGMTDAEVAVHIQEPFKKFCNREARIIGGVNDDCLAILRDNVNHYVRRF